MATPTISEYTAHLRQDKASMRNHLLSANITTKESDTFTDLTRIALEKGNAIRRIYVQPDEPAAKHGLWFKRDTVEDFDVVSDPVPFVGDTLSAFNVSYNPDSAYTKVKETKVIRANNTIYYLALESLKDSYPNESFRIYKYDPYTNTYTKIQTYTADEVYNVRGDGGYYAISVFRKNGVACIDSEGEYLYLIGGGYDALTESQKYITRFGLKSHSAERVHTRQSKWFPIPAGDSSNAQIVDNKIYIFGQSTNAAAYGNSWNTRIIDLTTGSESTLNHGPVAYQGRTVKVNSHLIAGFGGGAGSMNSGQGMDEVRLFDTLTNTSTKIATLTNKNNSRVLTVVGNLIYFVEYRNSGSSSKSVGYVNLVDNSVTYIDDVFTPKLQNIATSSSLYLPSARAIVLGNYIGKTYSYNLDTKPYDKDTVVLFQSTGVAAQYVVNLFTTNNFKTDVPFNISDAWFYKAGEGLETTGEVYYGNGTEWLPLVHGNTNGGVNALQLQHKTVEITDRDVHVVPDPGFEGLRYVDLRYTGDLQEDLTEELANYDTSLTTQETSIQDIIKSLEGKASGGGGGKYAPRHISFYEYNGTDLKDELANLDTSKVTDMSSMFYSCSSLTELDVSSLDTSKVTDMSSMFYSCSSLTELDVSSLDTSKVTIMYSMFGSCKGLTELDLSNFDTSSLTNTTYMFSGCTSLKKLDIRSFDFANLTLYNYMFGYDKSNFVPANCLIIVKDEEAKSWVKARHSKFTNIKTVVELEG